MIQVFDEVFFLGRPVSFFDTSSEMVSPTISTLLGGTPRSKRRRNVAKVVVRFLGAYDVFQTGLFDELLETLILLNGTEK